MALIGFLGCWYLQSFSAAFARVELVPFQVVSNYDLAVLPLFILMATICFNTGLSSDLYDFAEKLVGRMPGGLAAATILGCGFFSAISASSPATATTMGLVAIPEMKRHKYSMSLTTGSIAIGGTLGPSIPPSSILILFGILTELSIGKLFTATIIPGVTQAIFYVIVIIIICTIYPNLGPRGPKHTFLERISSLKKCGEIIGLIALIIGGLVIGWFTPTEAGAIGAFGAIVFSLIRKRLSWEKFKKSLIETLETAGLVYLLLIGAYILMYFTTVTTIPRVLVSFVGNLALPPYLVMFIIIVGYLILGTVMDSLAMMMLTVPILYPVIVSMGFDGIWFGIIVCRVTEVAMVSPPIGLNLFVTQSIAGVPISTVYKGIIPFLIADIVQIGLLLAFPTIVLFLPSVMH